MAPDGWDKEKDVGIGGDAEEAGQCEQSSTFDRAEEKGGEKKDDAKGEISFSDGEGGGHGGDSLHQSSIAGKGHAERLRRVALNLGYQVCARDGGKDEESDEVAVDGVGFPLLGVDGT